MPTPNNHSKMPGEIHFFIWLYSKQFYFSLNWQKFGLAWPIPTLNRATMTRFGSNQDLRSFSRKVSAFLLQKLSFLMSKRDVFCWIFNTKQSVEFFLLEFQGCSLEGLQTLLNLKVCHFFHSQKCNVAISHWACSTFFLIIGLAPWCKEQSIQMK